MADGQTKKISLNIMIARVLAVSLVLAAIVMALPIYGLHNKLTEDKHGEIHHHAEVVLNQVVDKLQSLSTTGQHMASLREVRDMLNLGDLEDAQAWSINTRKLFPGSVGFGLINEEGDYLGDTNMLRIGPACQLDASHFMHGRLYHKLPVHDDNPELAHFDILQYVRNDEGKSVGVLLMSFRLSVLQEVLNRYVEEGLQYRLKNADGKLLADTGNVSYPYRFSIPVPATDWLLEVAADDQLGEGGKNLVVVSIVSLVIVLLLFGFGVGPYIKRQLQSDVNAVRALMKYENLGDAESKPPEQDIRLVEFSGLLEDIGYLAKDISHAHSKLETQANMDELTGVMNRRAFEKSRERLYQLATGQVLILVLLDIDYFKQINDTFGHAAGDYALRSLGSILKASVRSTDEIFRLGGDELLVVFTSDNRANLQQWYDALSARLSAEMTRLEGTNDDGTAFTLSAGATVVDTASDSTFSVAMVRADTALYEAKDSGRAKMVIA
jgi:diguanylate cyclase (GGDEF)-like protein